MDEPNAYFVDATLDRDGKTYRLSKAEADRFATQGRYWHGPGDPSSWLCVAVFQKIQTKYPELPQIDRLELGARAMQISASKLRSSLIWHEQYMRFHDGDASYRVLEPDPEADK